MSADTDAVFKVLCELLEPFNSARVTLTPETKISADLNIDSMAIMDFIMEVEDKYDIDIPLNELSDIHTMDQLATYVSALMAGKEQ